MKKISLLIVLLPLLIACVNNKAKNNMEPTDTTVETDTIPVVRSSYFFSGDFMYFADAATFHDCVTNSTIPVAMQGIYKDVERKYLDMKLNDREGINCQVMGYLIDKPVGEEGLPVQLVITDLIQFDRTSACHSGSVTNTVYAFYTPDQKNATEKMSLTLDADYTFQATTYNLKTKEQLSLIKGQWHRTSDENIVFLTNDEVYLEGTIDFTNMDLKLYDNNNKLCDFKKEI